MGGQLYRLGLQSRQIADRLLSMTLLSWGLSYLVYDAFVVFAERGAQPPPWISFPSVFVMYFDTIAFAFFPRSVFRRHEVWAGWLVAAISTGLIAGLAGSLVMGDWSGGDPIGNPWYWPKWACGAAPLVWMGAEGSSHFARARQRPRLGLCEPLDCNRCRLWWLAGVLWAALECVVIGQDIVYQRIGAWSGSVGPAVCWLEIVPVVLIGLVFFARQLPPLAQRIDSRNIVKFA